MVVVLDPRGAQHLSNMIDLLFSFGNIKFTLTGGVVSSPDGSGNIIAVYYFIYMYV